MDTIKVMRFGLEDAHEDSNDVRLCEGCAHAYGWFETRGGERRGEYEGYELYWLTDDAEEGWTQCEDCGAYHGEPESYEQEDYLDECYSYDNIRYVNDPQYFDE